MSSYQVYFVTFGLLLILLVQAFTDREPHFLQYRLYIGILAAVTLCTVVEFLTWVLDGRLDSRSLWIAKHLSMTLFVFNISPLMLWVLYVDYQVYQNLNRIRWVSAILAVFFVANAMTAIASLRFGLYFYYDAANVYQRGPLHPVATTLYFCLLCYVLFLPIANRASLPARIRWPLILFLLPSVAGVVAQIVVYGLNLTWAGAALSLQIINSNIQHRISSTDFLTGLYNRRQLDSFLRGRVKNLQPDSRLAVLMMDIDKFKHINDEFGHRIGDAALECAATVLRKTFHHHDFIARYAGDEFVVALEYARAEDLQSIRERLQGKIDQFNASGEQPFFLSISVGTAVYDPLYCSTPEELLKRADSDMYAAKRAADAREGARAARSKRR